MGKYFLFSLFPVWSPGSGRLSKQMSTINNPTTSGWRCIYTNVQLLLQEWILGILGWIHHFLLKSYLGNLAGIPGENLCFFQNIFLVSRSKSFLLHYFPLYWIHIWQTKQPGVSLRQSLTSTVKIIQALQPAWLCFASSVKGNNKILAIPRTWSQSGVVFV